MAQRLTTTSIEIQVYEGNSTDIRYCTCAQCTEVSRTAPAAYLEPQAFGDLHIVIPRAPSWQVVGVADTVQEGLPHSKRAKDRQIRTIVRYTRRGTGIADTVQEGLPHSKRAEDGRIPAMVYQTGYRRCRCCARGTSPRRAKRGSKRAEDRQKRRMLCHRGAHRDDGMP